MFFVRAYIVRCIVSGAAYAANVLKKSQTVRIKMLGKAMSSLFKSLKRAAGSRVEVLLRRVETWKYFPIIVSYCYDFREAKGMSEVLHGAGRQHLCIRCHSTHKGSVMGGGSSSRMVPETMETQRKV